MNIVPTVHENKPFPIFHIPINQQSAPNRDLLGAIYLVYLKKIKNEARGK